MLKSKLVKHTYKVFVVCDVCNILMLMCDTDNTTNPLDYAYKCPQCGRVEIHPVINGERITETFSFDPLEEDNDS